MSPNSLPVILRGPTSEDSNFLLNSWLRELEYNRFYPYRFIHTKTFNTQQTAILQTLIANSLVLIACNQEEFDQIYGYIIFEKLDPETILHFLYVKKTFRNNGIGKRLLEAAAPDFGAKPIVITHLPRQPEGLDLKTYLIRNQLFFDPYVINRRLINKERA
jgi:ribosomal protein S18 acetylase RimI-like enzyme